MKLAIGLFLALCAPDFATAKLRRAQDIPAGAFDNETEAAAEQCADGCCKATAQAASIVESALLGCGQAATGYSNWGVSSEPETAAWGVPVTEESRRLTQSSTAMAYQPPNPTCLLLLCAAQRSASKIVENACDVAGEPIIDADICEYVPGFTPPIARNDSGDIVVEGGQVLAAVLENDRSVPGRYLVLNGIVSQTGLYGKCHIDYNKNDKEIRYKSNGVGEIGVDTCEYETCYENGPRLCDTATFEIEVVATPTQSPTSAPTNSPTETCKIGLDLTCDDCGSKQLATRVLCEEKPTYLSLKYNGGKCGQSDNVQTEKSECTDSGDGPPTESGAVSYIKVTNKDGYLYFKGGKKVGEFVPLTPKDNRYDSDMYVKIYKDSSYTTVLQEVKFHTSTSEDLRLLDKFGSVQISAFQNKYQNENVRSSVTLSIEVSNIYAAENVSVTELNLKSSEPFSINRDILDRNMIPNIMLPAGSAPKTFKEMVPIDLSVKQDYKYLLSSGGESDVRKCASELEQVFKIPN